VGIESYKDYPEILSEVKGYKEHNSGFTHPRDALIMVLKDIDNGLIKDIDSMIIVYHIPNETRYCIGGPGTTLIGALGLLIRAITILQE
jgi:hypothetical protein